MNFPDALVRQRSTAPDAYGNPGHDWTTPNELPFQGYMTPPPVRRTSTRRKDWAVYCPQGTDVLPGDRVKRGTEVYHVVFAADVRTPQGVIKMRQLDIVRIPDA